MIVFLEKQNDKQCYIYNSESRKIWDVIKLNEEIKELQCKNDYLAVATSKGVHVYSLPNLEKVKLVQEVEQPFVLVQDGTIVAKSSKSPNSFIHGGLTHASHENALSALSYNQTRIATASEKGTLIRVWQKDKKVWEGRRGIEPARIVSMDMMNENMVISTKKGSVHYFNLNDTKIKGYIWSQFPKSRYTWYFGDNPIVTIGDTQIYIADETGLISIVSMETGEIMYQTSLTGDSSSPFAVPSY